MREYGLQLYSIRNAITENYHDALRQVAEMGYKMAELYGGIGSRRANPAQLDG